MLTFTKLLRDPIPDHEQKQVALTYLHEAWAEAHLDGVDGDCMAQACLFRALSELIGTSRRTCRRGSRTASSRCAGSGSNRDHPFEPSVSRNRTGSPCSGVARLPSHITRRPRITVPTGQPVTVWP
jgi:hypothetical protein